MDDKKREAFSYFGLEDMVVNHALLIMDIDHNKYDVSTLEQRANPSIMSKRFFTVQCISYFDGYSLSTESIDQMKEVYEGSCKIIMKGVLQ